ncbi:LLM class flavin-dependent oxidoreductase [Staphylococcus pettenkoferi]|uniref:LLM class flavin-dependent oxidoreductase n=1 Tax=Staphylococcus pettenkoferi TaxID=170573 RepID=UPI00066A494A|nr:LLM class flavin-dependent oxidoreductase [Staphylococcus pettenkoferi]MDK7114982.1 LLM class flavin-dependent oxidoreductase [Staphylococcus pettenkoferi]MDK7283375.1 LLM class flavin-dependent oxidoreductase [Staphylococcus pettenkoferi]
MVRLSILDYSQIDEGKDAEQALQDTIRLAKLADRLGYHRFWVTEHHNVPAFACSSPELLMMYIASQTEQIRVGSGGVMLPHYSPYKVAENMRMLETFYPHRVDVGVGNTYGTLLVKRALDEMKSEYKDYRQSVTELKRYLAQLSVTLRGQSLVAQPVVSRMPEMWLLSTSERTGRLAGELGLGFTVGTFLLPNQRMIDGTKRSVAAYRSEFEASEMNTKAHVMVTAFIVIAETEDEAEQLAQALDIWLLGKKQFAEFERFPSIQTAQDYQPTDRDQERMTDHRSSILVGTAQSIQPQLETLIEMFDADEVLVSPLLPGIEARCKAIELLAETI